MTKKTNNEEEVMTSAKKTTIKKSTTTRKRKTAPKVVEVNAEVVEETAPKAVPRKVLNDNGEVDLSLIPKTKLKHYADITKALNENDMSTIMNYGSDLQSAMDSYSNDFLNQRFSSADKIESAQLISNLLGELQEVDIDELNEPSAFKRLMRRIPLLKKMIVSVEQIKAKYNTIQKNIDGITEKLEKTRLRALKDNSLLEHQFQNNLDYVHQLGELIIAGKLKSKQLEDEIATMKDNTYEHEDWQIKNIENFKDSLDKKLTDLTMMRLSFQQSLVQIKVIQQTNMQDAQNTEAQIKYTIPIWKSQLSLAVALYNQKKSLEAHAMVTNATNDILKKNSSMMKTQAIEVAKQSQRTVIDIDTLERTHRDLIDTLEGVKKAQEEGRAKRLEAERKIQALEKEMHYKSIGVQESTERVMARELIDASN